MRGVLSEASVYLAGQVECDHNCGSWRQSLTADFRERLEGMRVWDPLIKPGWMSQNSRNDRLVLDKSAIFSHGVRPSRATWEANAEIRRVCRSLAGQCNIMVAKLSEKFTWGSIDELEIGISRNIPIFMVLPDGPLGLYGITAAVTTPDLMPYYIHYSTTELLKTLVKIHRGESELPNLDPTRWLFLTYPDATENRDGEVKQGRARYQPA